MQIADYRLEIGEMSTRTGAGVHVQHAMIVVAAAACGRWARRESKVLPGFGTCTAVSVCQIAGEGLV